MNFENGKLIVNEGEFEIQSIPWVAHPNFEGVFMKDLILGNKTDGKLSCHIVKVQKGFEIKNHIHTNSTELHEVIAGSGYSIVDNIKKNYCSGTISIIEKGINHSVKAENETIFMLAKFFPAIK